MIVSKRAQSREVETGYCDGGRTKAIATSFVLFRIVIVV